MNTKAVILAIIAAICLLMPLSAPAEEASDPQKLKDSYALAIDAINAGDYGQAKQYLSVCLAYCDPDADPGMYADLWLKWACISVIEEEDELALRQLNEALRAQPDLADAYLVRAQIYTARGDVDRAVESLETYIDLTGDTSLYETVAQLYAGGGDAEAARAAYDRYVAGAGGDVAEAGFQSGLYRMQAGEYREAIAEFEAYVDDETYGAGALYNIAICRMSMKDYGGAVEAFTRCVGRGGGFDGLYYNRGVCRMMTRDWAGAMGDFNRAIQADSHTSDARLNLGICLMELKRYEEAIAAFTALIDAEGEQAGEVAYEYRALCRAAADDLEGAIEDYTHLIQRGYEPARTYERRAQVYAAMGDREREQSDLESARRYAMEN